MSVKIKEIELKNLRQFVDFSFKLYKKSKQWVPPIIKEEIKSLNKTKNNALKKANVRYFLAYKNNKPVGRIASIININEVENENIKKIRFGWFDFIDDLEVSRTLLDKIEEIGKLHHLKFMEGPVGVSNIDKAGMLTYGYELMGKASTLYNYNYYPKHLKKLNFEFANKWLEYGIVVPEDTSKLRRISKVISDKFGLIDIKFNTKKEIMSMAEEMFGVMNKSFSKLETFTEMQPHQIKYYKKKYAHFIHPDYVSFLFDKNKKMLGFGITIPDFSKALKKANGHLFPFGFLHLIRSFKSAKRADLMLIGILPEFQNKGFTAIMFSKIVEAFKNIGIVYVEVGPGLETNDSYHALWRNYDPKIIRKRATFRKNLTR